MSTIVVPLILSVTLTRPAVSTTLSKEISGPGGAGVGPSGRRPTNGAVKRLPITVMCHQSPGGDPPITTFPPGGSGGYSKIGWVVSGSGRFSTHQGRFCSSWVVAVAYRTL